VGVALSTDEEGGQLMAGVEDHGMDLGECPDMPSMAVTFPGPFEHHDVVVNGWRVPFVDAHMQGEDRVMLVLDRRLAADFSSEEAERFVPFLADAIAIALGYPAHPSGETEYVRSPLPRLTRTIDIARVVPEAGC
jgi:hypothetical protein